MISKTSFVALALLLSAITGVGTSPVYLYLHNPETNQCDIRDSAFRYTPVPAGTLRAVPIVASIGESNGNCDTIYVLVKP